MKEAWKDVPPHWRIRKARYGLVGKVCGHCDTKIFPSKVSEVDPYRERTRELMDSLNAEENKFKKP